MKMRKIILNAIAQVGYKSAIKAGGTASQYGIHQAKEPMAVSEIRNKRMHM
jgi:cyclic lactone autoinducer peptide